MESPKGESNKKLEPGVYPSVSHGIWGAIIVGSVTYI